MKIGFTGTQKGMTDAQKNTLRNILWEYGKQQDQAHEFHHGDCIGADAQANEIAYICRMYPVIHPPALSKKRAFINRLDYMQHLGPIIVLPPKPYLARNRTIVNSTEWLIGAPKENEEVLRSGTWATIRYASARNKRITIIWPDGRTNSYFPKGGVKFKYGGKR